MLAAGLFSFAFALLPLPKKLVNWAPWSKKFSTACTPHWHVISVRDSSTQNVIHEEIQSATTQRGKHVSELIDVHF